MAKSQKSTWFSLKANQGGPKHLKARDRVIKLLESIGFTCVTQQKFEALTPRGQLTYEPDILASRGPLQVVVEIDGKSHWNKIPRAKDSYRDEWFKDIAKLPTVRYAENWVIGRKKFDNETLLDHFWWELSRNS